MITKRSKRTNGSEDTFAVTPLNLPMPRDASYFRNVVATGSVRSARAWQWYKAIGEVHYAVSRSCRVAGYGRLFICKRNADGTPGKEVNADGTSKLAAIARELQSPYGGQRGLLERFMLMSKVPGDCFLIAVRENDEIVGYDVVGASEIHRESVQGGSLGARTDEAFNPTAKLKRIILPSSGSAHGDEQAIEIEARDMLGRIYRPGGEFVGQADSPMMSLDEECEVLHLLTLSMKSKVVSRLAMNGIMYIPAEISDVQSAAPKNAATEETMIHSDNILDGILKACLWAMQNHSSADAAMPIFLKGPAQYADAVKHIVYDRVIAETDMKLRAELIDRILYGLDIEPNDVKGVGDSNHWSAWAVSDSERRINVQPDVENLCWALDRLVLNRRGLELDIPESTLRQHMVWYDLTGANVKTNLAEDGRQAWDRGGVSDDELRRTSGIPETGAPSDEQRLRQLGWKTGNAYLATFGLPIAEKIDWEKAGTVKPGPTADSPGDKAPVGPGVGDPGSTNPSDRKNNGPKSSRPS